MNIAKVTDPGRARRRFPRREFKRKMGILFKGQYFIAQTEEVGEGGMSFLSEYVLDPGSMIVVNFQIPNGDFVSVRAEVKSSKKQDDMVFHGVSFLDIEFGKRRQIRMYVSSQNN